MKYYMQLLIILSLLCLSSCHRQDTSTSVDNRGGEKNAVNSLVSSSVSILSKPMNIHPYEVDIQSIPDYLSYRGKTLVLISFDPFLAPIPTAMKGEFESVFLQGGEELRRRLWRVADPLLTPGMLTHAVLKARIFRRIVWVLPTTSFEEQIDLEKFKTVLNTVGLIGAETFHKELNGTLTGEIEGVRFDVVTLAALPEVIEPIVLHIDLSYFAASYKNEIKTPLIPLVGETLRTLRSRKWNTDLVTLSFSNHTGQVPLTLRPLAPIIRQIFSEPRILDSSMPENWKLFGDTLYLENFFQNEETQRLLTRMEENEPKAAWVKYLRSNFSRQLKDEDSAERFLTEAVKGDIGYALEYMKQAEIALQRKKTEKALTNMRKLVAAIPEDPLFRLSLCEELFEQKRFDEVLTMLPELSQLHWSPIYYPEVPQVLEYFQKMSKKN